MINKLKSIKKNLKILMKDNNEKEQIQMQIQKIRITQNFYANKSENSEKMYYFLEIIFYQK